MFDCQEAAGGAASTAVGRRLPYALDRIAYDGRHDTQDTVPARRVDIGEDAGDKRSLAQVKLSQPVRNYATVFCSDPRGVSGQVVPGGTPAVDPQRPQDFGSKATNS
jgi:hypothetical protein